MVNLQIIIRSILKQGINSAIIVVSLATGIACLSLIALFVSHEMNADQFHAFNKQIYALKCNDPWSENSYMYHARAGSAEYMMTNFSQVDDFCRINNNTPQKIIANKQAWFGDAKVIAASDNFFGFFSYNLITGNPATVLASNTDLVVSEKLALKYFGTSDVVGQPITLVNRNSEDQMTITGVFREPDERTQIHFDMVRRIDINVDSRCYLRLAANANPSQLEKQFETAKNTIPVIHGGTPGAYYLASLKEAYFDQARGSAVEVSRNKNELWLALIVGFLIFSIASFNYLGLVNNQLIQKDKEFAIRKINGASKFSIISHFMTENLVVLLISFAISLLLVTMILPTFNSLTGAAISPSFIFRVKQLMLLGAIVFLVLIFTLVFVYFRIKTNEAIQSLKSKKIPSVKSFRFPVFHVFQIAASIILIVCSIIIVRQIHFIANKPIGINRDVIEVKIPGQYHSKAILFRDELLKNSAIDIVSVAGASPVLEHFLVLLEYERDGIKKQYSPAGFTGDENYLSALGIELLEGSDFSENISSNSNKCLINESLAAMFQGENLIGKGLPGMDDKIVVGVVRDFHYSSLKTLVEPAFISFGQSGKNLIVKVMDKQSGQAHDAIIELWEKLIPDYPVNIETIGDRFQWRHRENTNYILLLGSCCAISIFLSMIGLFAISFQSSRLRTKEIGIRKVNGAKTWEVMVMLNRDFVIWIATAFFIATPIAWYAMNRWLQNFAYKTELSWWIFALAGFIALGIALLTISFQSWRAARRNPVEALRYE